MNGDEDIRDNQDNELNKLSEENSTNQIESDSNNSLSDSIIQDENNSIFKETVLVDTPEDTNLNEKEAATSSMDFQSINSSYSDVNTENNSLKLAKKKIKLYKTIYF